MLVHKKYSNVDTLHFSLSVAKHPNTYIKLVLYGISKHVYVAHFVIYLSLPCLTDGILHRWVQQYMI